jgi:hypothetical protein
VFSTTVRQRRSTRPRDIGYGEEPLRLRWHKRQYACVEDGCPRKAFTESIAELPPGARLTGRLRRAASATVEAGASVATAVRSHHISWPIVHAAYVARADAALTEPEPVAVLGLDETRRGRPRWRKDPATGGWVKLELFETNFVDLVGGARRRDGPMRGLPFGGAGRAAGRADRR